MPPKVLLNKKDTTFSEAFEEYISDIALEVEGIRLKMFWKEMDGINTRIDRINNALLGIMDAKMSLAKNSNNFQD